MGQEVSNDGVTMGKSETNYYEKYWDHGISSWSPKGVRATSFEERLLGRFLQPSSRVMDFGCGDGSHVGPFAKALGCSYVGLDVSLAAVGLCRQKGLDAIEHNPESPLPFQRSTFDCVVSFEVFEHVFDPQLAVQEIHRVLREGSYLVGSVPNSVHLANRFLMALGYFNPGGSPETSLRAPWKDPHIRFFNKNSLLAFLERSGFEECRVLGTKFSLGSFPRLYRAGKRVRRGLEVCSAPFGFLGKLWPNLLSDKLYFIAKKPT
jgi:SAM-dependent methyltransferase